VQYLTRALEVQILMGGRKMSKLFGFLSVVVLGLALGAFVPEARATQLDFGCNSGTCSGNVTVTGSNYSASGIGLTNTDATAPPSYSGSAWTLAFDTSTGAISLNNGSLGTLSGIIEGFSATNGSSSATLTLTVMWNSLPPAVQGFFGGEASATDLTSILYLGSTTTSGGANSVGITMFPTPEPASLVLLGSGLLALGASLRKKLGSSGQI
jgi:hypothetical protein